MSLPWKKRVSLKRMTKCAYDSTKAQTLCCILAKNLAKELREDRDLQEIHYDMGTIGRHGGAGFEQLLDKLFLWGDLNRIWFDTKF